MFSRTKRSYSEAFRTSEYCLIRVSTRKTALDDLSTEPPGPGGDQLVHQHYSL